MSFKVCTKCGRNWGTRDAFLSDPAVELIGYQVHFDSLQTGLFLFNHCVPECETTMSVQAGQFFDLYKGPVFQERKTGTAECTGMCLRRDDLGACIAKCECAFVREILGIVARWPKTSAA